MIKKIIFAALCITSLQAQVTNAQTDNWKQHTIDSLLAGADGVKLKDVNGDGLMDIATGWEEGNQTKVYLNPGHKRAGKLWKSVVVGKTPCVEDALFCDFDGNGIYDVVTSTEGWNKEIYFHWSPEKKRDYLDSTKWRQESLPAAKKKMQWMYAQAAQINGKNGIDIVVGAKNKNAQLGWFESPADPRKIEDWMWRPICDVSWIMSVEMIDMDGDGDIDILYSDRKPGVDQGIYWAENPGECEAQKELWKTHLVGCKDQEVMFLTVTDYDQDGLDDVIVTECTSRQIVIIRKEDKGGKNWQEIDRIDIPKHSGTPKSVAVTDIDGDGQLDIIHSAERSFDNKEGIFWLSKKSGEWQWHSVSGSKGIKYDKIELIDLDGDCDLDILTCEEREGVGEKGLGIIWYENPFRK